MHTDATNDRRIIASWHANAPNWVVAVRDGQIESRRRVTDQAIIDAVLSREPRSVLDIGCGEGWLARALAARDIAVIGIDAVATLVDAARSAGGGDFRVMTYAQLGAGELAASVDTIVCNFALFGNASVRDLLETVPSLLNANGVFVIQTLHPVSACGDQPYRDGWREGSWAGFDPAFTHPAPWYFRTLESWERLFAETGLRLLELREPVHPDSQQPASVIFMTTPR